MKIISAEEASQFELKSRENLHKPSKFQEYYDAITNLQEGQTLIVKKDEWPGRSDPSVLAHTKLFKKITNFRKFHFFSLADESGWLISPKKTN